MLLAGKVALVTGGNRGVGRGIALCLGREGADVAINYRQGKETAEATGRDVAALGRSVRSYQCDVASSYDAVYEMVDRVIADFGQLDILVNNAAIMSPRRTLHDFTIDDFLQVFNTNFHGPLYCTRAVLPHFRRRQRGHLVYISSSTVVDRPGNRSPYVASKLAMEGLASVVAMEELSHGVHVNVVRSGPVETDMGQEVFKARGIDDVKSVYSIAPFGRVTQPEDIGNTVVFLCSDWALHVNNAVVPVDAGGLGWMPARKQ